MTRVGLTEVGEVVATAWRRALALDAVPPGANFFLAGGDSLAGVAVAAELTERLGVPITLTDLLESPDFDGFVDLVAGLLASQPHPDAR